jgi:hypothetical protein
MNNRPPSVSNSFKSRQIEVTEKLTTASFVALSSNTPTLSSSTGTPGTIVWDVNYLYVCTGTNTWKRAALSAWN